ncbi:MAG: AEC family transporter [Gammaproteobacteria bacterium]|nr:AEC family transporter [Gammaproteobacteria bacterium]
MLETLVQMIGLILCGVVWRWIKMGNLPPEQARYAITELVYYLLLPALVLVVLWRAPMGMDSVQISMLANMGIIFALVLSGIVCRACKMPPKVTGTIMIASAFPNATYLGLPVLQAIFGDWARSVAIQYDLFAATPLLFTVGILIAQHFGTVKQDAGFISRLIRIPPLWAAIAGTLLNLLAVPINTDFEKILNMLGNTVVPLMLVALGMSLQWRSISMRQIPPLMIVAIIQLLLTPLLVWQVGLNTGLSGDLLVAVVLEASMPSMVIGLVLCDRYGLDTSLYATAVTTTTLLSLISLPLWFSWV